MPLSKSQAAESQEVVAGEEIFVAGIGASAGGLEALKNFFDHTHPALGIAYVVIQHLSPSHESLLRGLLSTHTSMEVVEARDGVRVEANTVYVIPPNKDLTIEKKVLRLHKMEAEAHGLQKRPIDSFLHSLAEDSKGKAIGIILSGTGRDGAVGMGEIHAAGGLTLVQTPESAEFAGMPEQSIRTNVIDFVLPPEEMAAKLSELIVQRGKQEASVLAEPVSAEEQQLRKIFHIIRTQVGHDYSNYKKSMLLRRIGKRMSVNQIVSVDAYIHLLEQNPEEVNALNQHFLIGVTSFFRDKAVFESLEKKAIPYLIGKCGDRQEIRVWVCGCATGEEAYSIAISFKESFQSLKRYLKVMIFASDVDKEAIGVARVGIYAENQLGEVSAERRSRHFTQVEKGYQVKKEIRAMVVFAHHNLIKDPPFSKMDLISCRNLLIYIDGVMQQKIIPLFHYSLNKDGILLLGSSESIREFGELFMPFDDKNKFFLKKDNHKDKPRAMHELSFLHVRKPSGLDLEGGRKTEKKVNVGFITERLLLDEYAPPSVIVDRNNDVIYFSGDTGLYLEPASGIARFHVVDMAKKGLKMSLQAAIRKARKKNGEVEVKGVEVLVHDSFKTITLKVKPLYVKEYELGTLMVIFESTANADNTGSQSHLDGEAKRKSKHSDLEKELKVARERLQMAIKELEIANEDLQSTNEEFQSSNEELQSTNEELETSREELQSVNEELISVNSELSNKIELLSEANNDLNNLLRSMEVATVYLDLEMKIKRFTPAAVPIFNLIPSDIDRPVTQLSTNLLYQGLAADVKVGLETLAVKSVEVQAQDGTWYHLRIIPYRTSNHSIEGVLVTLVDITVQKTAALELAKANEELHVVMEKLPAIVFSYLLEPVARFVFMSASCAKITGFPEERFCSEHSFWVSRIHGSDRRKILSAFSRIAKTKREVRPFRWKCGDGKFKHFVLTLNVDSTEKERVTTIVGIWQEASGNQITG